MLSPHEFATLLLVKDAPNQVDMDREELDALFERQLVQLEKLASGLKQWRLTEIGDSAIRAIKRFSIFSNHLWDTERATIEHSTSGAPPRCSTMPIKGRANGLMLQSL